MQRPTAGFDEDELMQAGVSITAHRGRGAHGRSWWVGFPTLAMLVASGACARRAPAPSVERPLQDAAPTVRAPGASAGASVGAITEICVGALHACARNHDGAVACWGDNESHQIAATMAQFDHPSARTGLPQAESLRCGDNLTCVRTALGEVWCRGGAIMGVNVVKLALPGRAKDFILHHAGGCAILEDGRLACWHGEGNRPLLVDAATGATKFALAAPDAERVCVLRKEAAPVCIDAAQWLPVPVGGHPQPPEVRGIEVAEDFVGAKELLLSPSLCGRLADGRVQCRPGPLATAWAGMVATEFVASGGGWACLRDRGGHIQCASTFAPPRDSQRLVQAGIPPDASMIALGDGHGCAILAGEARCWGEASHGQLGDGTRYLHDLPIQVPGIDDAVGLAAAEAMACAVRKTGKVVCWGTIDTDYLRSTFPGFSPTDMAFPETATEVVVGPPAAAARLCAKGSSGWRCYQNAAWVASPAPSLDRGFFARAGVRVRSLAPDGYCGIDAKGQIVCGSCGVCGRVEAQATLTRIDQDAPFVEVASLLREPMGADRVVCGRTERETVRCKRARAVPFAREKTPEPLNEPTIDALTEVTKLSCLGRPSMGQPNLGCALTKAGVVHCWGDGLYGQLGSPFTPRRASAAPVGGLPPVVDLVSGADFACARTSSGAVHCWGSNRQGAVPDGAPALRKQAVRVRWPAQPGK